MKSRGIVLGAGIIGSAVAYELSRRGVTDLSVIDIDFEGALSSTERNAGGVRHLWNHQVNSDLAKHSIQFFEKIRDEIGFQQTGYLWLYSTESAIDGEETLKLVKSRGLSYEKWLVSKIVDHAPFIDKTDDLTFALFGAKDGLLNSNALKTYFRKSATQAGAQFHDRTRAFRVSENRDGKVEVEVEILPGQEMDSQENVEGRLKDPALAPSFKTEKWECEFVVVCAGAWSDNLLVPLTQSPLTQPVRRQIALFKAEDFDLNAYGMIVDTSRVYFHPEGGNILAGFVIKDEKPGFRFDYDSDFFENHIWSSLYERSSKFEKLKPVTGWGGLYSYTPDTSGLLGLIPNTRHIYECHSFTGRGVMQSYGAAIAIAELILDGAFKTFDASPLSRTRFHGNDKSRWLVEGLHI